MHFKGFLITNKIPNNNEIGNILDDYYYEKEENKSGFTWDWYQVGGRYGAKLKINAKEQFELNSKFEFDFLNRKRNNRLFISKILNVLESSSHWYDETDYLKYMGLRDNCLYVDGAYYEDLKGFDITDCYVVIAEDYMNIRERWDGNHFIKNENFDEEVKQIDLKGKFITIIDFHD